MSLGPKKLFTSVVVVAPLLRIGSLGEVRTISSRFVKPAYHDCLTLQQFLGKGNNDIVQITPYKDSTRI